MIHFHWTEVTSADTKKYTQRPAFRGYNCAKAFMKWNFYWIFINILTSGKFLEFLGIEFETSLVYCHSFSFSNNVCWMVSCNKIPRDSKVSFFLQCSKVRLIPLKKINIQACFFQFLWFFKSKWWFKGQIIYRFFKPT